MLAPQSTRFWQAALQSGLVDEKGMTSCLETIPAEKRVPDQIERRLARQAVQAGLLTLWQAQQLLAGRSTGFKIDRYVLLDLLGQGGMGRVYLAKDSRLNRRVAVKILSPERVNNPRAIARFHREALVGAQLQHENLVRIYDEGESNGKCYLVMEYIEGKNIGALISEKGPMDPRMAARLVRQVALGLDHAHQKGLIHRDVNPYNILVTHDGTAKLTDLGLAIDLAESGQVTRDGATVGTFDYVSPEQARHSHAVDTRSDIYSLGCTLYHMLSGQVPFPSPSLPEKLFGHQALEPESLNKLVPGLPEGLDDVVRLMMRKSPDERYPNPVAVAQALEPFVDDGPASFRDELESSGRPGSAQTTVTRITAARPAEAAAPEPAVTEAAPAVGASPAPPAPPAALAPAVGEAPTFDFGANLGAEPQPEGGLDLGLNFDAEPTPPPPSKKPVAAPAPAKPVKAAAPSPPDVPPPAAPAAPEPALDFGFAAPDHAAEGGLDLGLNFGPAPAAAEPPRRAAAKATAPEPAPVPAAGPAPAPPAPPPRPAPAQAPAPPPKAAEPVVAEPVPDFALSLGAEAPAEGGLDLGLNFGAPPPIAEPVRKPAPKAPAPAPAAKAPAPAPAAPSTPPAAPPAPASPPPAAPTPDFMAGLGGDAPAGGGLDLGLNFGAAPVAPEPARKPAPKAPAPAPAAKAPAAPVPAPTPAAPTPAPEFLLNMGGEAPAEGGFHLGLDLGPTPPVSEAPASTRRPAAPKPAPAAAAAPAPAPAPKASAAPAPAKAARRFAMDRRILIGVGAAGLFALALGVGAATGLIGSSSRPGAVIASKTDKGSRAKSGGKRKATEVASVKPTSARKSARAPAEAPPPDMKIEEPIQSGQGFAVRAPGSREVSYEPDLKGAMQRAIGSKGHVSFTGNATLQLKGEDAAINIGGGQLYLRAEPGARPILEVALKDQPFITTRTDTPLSIRGLTIVVRYLGPADKDAPALIEAGGKLTIENCAFIASGNVKGSRGGLVQGGGLVAKGCWFDGFDRALDVSVFPGTANSVTQCMMVRSKTDDRPIGWGLRIRNMPGGEAKPRRILLQNCTVRGKGFVELTDFTPESSLKLEVNDCAVQADALMAWLQPKPDTQPAPGALLWAGRDNLYDIRGKAWAVLSGQGAPEMPNGPTDLSSWAKLGTETGTRAAGIKFQTDPGALSELPLPVDFGVQDRGPRGPGADPAKVGPSAKP